MTETAATSRPAALFISYRRSDTGAFARDLHKHLAAGFGYERVFMDRAEIRAGQRWAERLDEELARSTVVLALIGPQWLSAQREDFRRRIDADDDWVRRELRVTLAGDQTVIPIYVDGAKPILDAKLLPPDLANLVQRQHLLVTQESLGRAMGELVRMLEQHGLRSARPGFRLPTRLKNDKPLTPAELDEAIEKEIPRWSRTGEERRVPYSEGLVPHSELYREYSFASFEQATAFMAEHSAAIDAGQHHPRWENFWTTVRVWLSTWDIEFKPSLHDVRLARWLDRAYAETMARASGQGAVLSAPPAAGLPVGELAAVPTLALCVPAKLGDDAVQTWLRLHTEWTQVDGKLERTLRFADFQSAFGFMTSVALAAEQMNHHPEWCNVYATVRIQLTTHDAGGISDKDFRLAERVDALAASHGVR